MNILCLHEERCGTCTELLMPCALQGRKSALEKFAGALFTTSVEGFIPATGRGVQVQHSQTDVSHTSL